MIFCFYNAIIKKIHSNVEKKKKKKKKLRYLREKYRDLINNRVKKIFNFKKIVNIKIIIEKFFFKKTKYINFNNNRRFKFIKRIITLINIIIFKIILYKSFYRNIFIIINFINNKSKNN